LAKALKSSAFWKLGTTISKTVWKAQYHCKCTWEIVGIYRAPNEDIRVIERLASRTGFLGNSIKRSIIGGDLNLPQIDWKGIAEGTSVTQKVLTLLEDI
jgi:hypothetical protein